TMASGAEAFDYRVTVSVRVVNSYSATSSLESEVVVLPPDSTFDYLSYVNSGVAAAQIESNNDLIFATINNAINGLTMVNCSLATNATCASYNRHACQSVPQTCSACFDG